MNELIDKVENLKKELDSSTLVLSVKDCLQKVREDSLLCSLLEEYSIHPKEEVKKQILENETFQEFKIKETELNLFIMEMNQKLKVISQKGSCRDEGH